MAVPKHSDLHAALRVAFSGSRPNTERRFTLSKSVLDTLFGRTDFASVFDLMVIVDPSMPDDEVRLVGTHGTVTVKVPTEG